MKQTCVGYYKKGDKYLFILRNIKRNDEHKGKYIGVGGHLEPGESPDEAMKREFKEETNLDIVDFKKLGDITYQEKDGLWQTNKMHVYFIYEASGERLETCDEGEFKFMTEEEFYQAPHWICDEIWLKDVFKNLEFGSYLMKYEKSTFAGAEHLTDQKYMDQITRSQIAKEQGDRGRKKRCPRDMYSRIGSI